MASTAFCNFNCFWLTLLRIADWLDWARPRGVCRVRDVDDIDITWQQCPSSSSSALLAPAPAPAPPSKSGKSSMAKVLAQLFLGLRFSLRFNCPLEVGTATSQRALSYCYPPPHTPLPLPLPATLLALSLSAFLAFIEHFSLSSMLSAEIILLILIIITAKYRRQQQCPTHIIGVEPESEREWGGRGRC